MPECPHKWKARANGKKEDCELCGAARVIDPGRCDHDWQLRPAGNKYGCSKCGAGMAVLAVQNVVSKQTAKTEG